MVKSHTSSTVVNDNNTAASMGSGSLPVFATPAMIALMENAAVESVKGDLPEGSTTVGTLMNVSHLKASKIGEEIKATATLTASEGRKYTFHVEARTSSGDLIGEGTHERFIVDIDKFLSRLG
jgi:fluoroacetyl-CoA thioesterase